MALGRATKPEPEPLGLVWLKCDAYPALGAGLRNSLEGYARVHVGRKPPAEAEPSFLILCAKGEEGLASELRRLRDQAPEATVLISGPRPEPQLLNSALNAGASGFVHGGLAPQRLVRVLSLASEGEIVVPRETWENLLEGGGPRADPSALTHRQLEILELVAEGHTNAAIAERLHISEHTVKQHLYKAYKALGVENRNQAARLFRKSNLGGTAGEGAA